MYVIKKIQFLIFVLFITTNLKAFDNADTSKFPLLITVENNGKGTCGKTKQSFNLKIKITNTADSVFAFWIMTCSWDNFVIFKPNNFKSCLTGCDVNYPFLVKLKKDETYTLDREFETKIKISKSFSFKAGFVVITKADWDKIKGENLEDDFDIMNYAYKKNMTKKDMVWSKLVRLKF
jgi:hypothetical protein